MRLLVISDNPDHASFRQRIGLYFGRLREQGIACEVTTPSGGMLERRRLYRRARDFDGVLLHRKLLKAWDAYWLGRSARTVIYDFDDAVMYSDRKSDPISRTRSRRFARSVRSSRLVIAGNEYLAEHARRHNAHVRILPTGLDVHAYGVERPRPNDGIVRLVWIGSGNQIKHLLEIRPVLEELGRRFPNVRLRIVSNEFFDLRFMRVEKCRWSPQTEVQDLRASDVGLAPMSDTLFTRGKCGFKILQYFAAALPVVASPVGVNAGYVREGVTGRLATTASEWGNRLTELVDDPTLRARMGQEASRRASDFDACVIGGQFVEWIRTCLPASRPTLT